jgi:tetratricopeptide (TPR) repeat protein
MTGYRISAETSPKNGGHAASVALSAIETQRLLASDPAAAEARAREFLTEQPGNLGALLLLGTALCCQNDFTAAKTILEPLTQSQPDLILAHYELGLALGGLGAHDEAIRVLKRAIDLMPNFAQAWYALAEQVEALQPKRTDLRDVRDAACAGRLAVAEALLLDVMQDNPDEASRFLLSIVLLAQERGRDALPLIERLAIDNPGNGLFRDLRAAAFFQIENFEAVIAQYEDILKDSPERPGAWMSYGRALRALGRQEQCVAAFKRAIELLPGWIEAYRTLASVKTYRFGPDEVTALRTLLARTDLPAANYAELHFALGRALEDSGQYAEALENYAKSNALQRANMVYSAEASTRFTRREMALYTAGFIRERAGAGCQSASPIFVVGMPRAGSTLVQEILCAHSAIERTGELRDLTWMTARLDQESAAGATGSRYPEVLRTYEKDRFRLLGEEYLQRTLSRRKLGRAFFVDKYSGNFYRTGLIHLILPNAKIVDVRRHPLDCCLSCFKHFFPEGLHFSHSLGDLGRYYADYVELMAHFDDVLPGKVHRVIYEQLVENPEREVRRLLDYLNLPFEEDCLRFFEKEQAVMTSSSEQVRVPIHKKGIGTWRHYEKWIEPLKSALGPVLDAYPGVPKFHAPMQISMTMRLA